MGVAMRKIALGIGMMGIIGVVQGIVISNGLAPRNSTSGLVGNYTYIGSITDVEDNKSYKIAQFKDNHREGFAISDDNNFNVKIVTGNAGVYYKSYQTPAFLGDNYLAYRFVGQFTPSGGLTKRVGGPSYYVFALKDLPRAQNERSSIIAGDEQDTSTTRKLKRSRIGLE
jgi:hypothetical protein